MLLKLEQGHDVAKI